MEIHVLRSSHCDLPGKTSPSRSDNNGVLEAEAEAVRSRRQVETRGTSPRGCLSLVVERLPICCWRGGVRPNLFVRTASVGGLQFYSGEATIGRRNP